MPGKREKISIFCKFMLTLGILNFRRSIRLVVEVVVPSNETLTLGPPFGY